MATHERLARVEPAAGSSDRGFGLVFAAVFAAIALLPLWRGGDIRWWSLAVAAAFLIIALTYAPLLAPLNRLWMRFGQLLHRIVNPVIMAVAFYGVITPTALIMRALGKDPLRRRFEPDAASYWIVREPPGPAPESIKNQF